MNFSFKRYGLFLLLVLLGAVVVGYHVYNASGQETQELTPMIRATAPGEFLRLSEGTVHYDLEGPDSGKLVVLIHGGGVTGLEVWKSTTPALVRGGFHVLSYDLYGRGYSDRPRVANTPELFRGQLAGLLERLHLSRQPCSIIALSMGGMIALDYAANYPGRVSKLALIDPAATGSYHMNRLLRIPVLSQLIMTDWWYPRSIENQRKEFVNMSLFDQYATRLAYFMNFKGYKRTNYSTWQYMLGQSKLNLLPKAADDILLIYGTDDPYFSKELAARYCEEAPRLRLQPVDSAGHMPQYERPEIVNPVLLQFLEK